MLQHLYTIPASFPEPSHPVHINSSAIIYCILSPVVLVPHNTKELNSSQTEHLASTNLSIRDTCSCIFVDSISGTDRNNTLSGETVQ